MIEAQSLAEGLKNIPAEAVTVIIGMTPIFELRGAIPVALGFYKMSLPAAYFWAVLGNILPTIAIIFLLEGVADFLSRRFDFWRRFFDWLFERTRKKTADKIAKYGAGGLFLLVAIPLPMTGGWTGALAAFLFGIKKKKAIPVIALGIMTAGLVVTLITVGLIKL